MKVHLKNLEIALCNQINVEQNLEGIKKNSG